MSATNGSIDLIWYRQFVSDNWLQWPHLTPSSGRFFQKVTDRWADHRNQLLVRRVTLKCLAKPNPATIPHNDLLLSKNPAKDPILVNCTNQVIENESKLPVWTTATLTRLHKWYLIRSPWTPIALQMRSSNLTANGPATLRRRKTVNDWTRGQLVSRTSLFQVATHTQLLTRPKMGPRTYHNA